MDRPPKIPFNRPFIVGKELFYISQAVLGGHLAGDGEFTRRCNRWLEDHFGALRTYLTHSCAAALDMAAILCDIQPGDEVVMPSYSYVSTTNSFVLRGARVRFVDIREDTLNIDETGIEDALTSKTKAIVPVHYAGVGAEMDTIMEIAGRKNLVVVEDAAQGVDATYKGKYLGTIGHIGTYSFHETKNYISGEGGALLVNDERFLERTERIRDKGTDRSKCTRGEVDRYSWVDVGSSYQPSELIAAFLFAQLEEAETITRRRWEIFNYYFEALLPLQEQGMIRLPVWQDYCRHNAHLFYLILTSERKRDALIGDLKNKGIHAVFHYVPLHTSPMGRKLGYRPGDLPVTEKLSSRLLRLPCYFELTREEQDQVIESVTDSLKQ